MWKQVVISAPNESKIWIDPLKNKQEFLSIVTKFERHSRIMEMSTAMPAKEGGNCVQKCIDKDKEGGTWQLKETHFFVQFQLTRDIAQHNCLPKNVGNKEMIKISLEVPKTFQMKNLECPITWVHLHNALITQNNLPNKPTGNFLAVFYKIYKFIIFWCWMMKCLALIITIEICRVWGGLCIETDESLYDPNLSTNMLPPSYNTRFFFVVKTILRIWQQFSSTCYNQMIL